MAGLLIALMAAVNSLKAKENLNADLLKQNARRSIMAAGFTASLATLGAMIFIGGLLTVFLAK